MSKLAKGNFRFYFNQHRDWPLVFSVDMGCMDSEIKLASVECSTRCLSQYDANAPENHPKAWMETLGVLRIKDNRATISNE